jgi:succinate-semialdehyde dehydrogenase/glutarate-semialdehyde dehydrogenase
VTAIATELLRSQAYVDGTWIDADSGETFRVFNPATGETRRAIAAAEAALPQMEA